LTAAKAQSNAANAKRIAQEMELESIKPMLNKNLIAYEPKYNAAKNERTRRLKKYAGSLTNNQRKVLTRRQLMVLSQILPNGPRKPVNVSKFRQAGRAMQAAKKIENQVKGMPESHPVSTPPTFKSTGLAVQATLRSRAAARSKSRAGNKPLTRGIGSVKKREKTPAENVNLGSFFEAAEAEKAAKNVTAGAIASIIKKNENNRRAKAAKNITAGAIASVIKKNENNRRAKAAKNITAGAIASIIKKNKAAANKAAANKAVANANLGSFFEAAEAEKAAKNVAKAEEILQQIAKYTLANVNGKFNNVNNRITILGRNTVKKELVNAARERIKQLRVEERQLKRSKEVEIQKLISNNKKKFTVSGFTNSKKNQSNLEGVLARLEKLNTNKAAKIFSQLSNNNRARIIKNEDLRNRYIKFTKKFYNDLLDTRTASFSWNTPEKTEQRKRFRINYLSGLKSELNKLNNKSFYKKYNSLSVLNKTNLGKTYKNRFNKLTPVSRVKNVLTKIRDTKPPPPPIFNEATVRNALGKYLDPSVKTTYNKALMNAILKLPNLNNNTRRRLQSPRMYALQRGAVAAGGALGRGAGAVGSGAWTGTKFVGNALGRGASAAVRGLMKPRIEKLKETITNPHSRRVDRENAIRELYAISKNPKTIISNITNAKTFLSTLQNNNLNSIVKGQQAPGLWNRLFAGRKPATGQNNGKGATGGGFFSSFFARKPAGPSPPFIPFKKGMKIPLGYVLRRNNKNKGLGYYKNNKALASQLEHSGYGPAPKPTSGSGISVGVGPRRDNYGYGRNYGYGSNVGGSRGPSGGIVFAPKINVGAARIGAQTFGGTRVGGQQMGGSRVRTGNTGSTTLKTGNAGRLTVSGPTSNGNRQLASTSEQLIRGAGGAEAVEQGIKALNATNGNVTRAKAMSKLPNNTFTNIYAMGGPVAAKRLVEQRRRRHRTTGGRRVASKKKRVARKPKKQYIKLTPYQFRRLTDHIKKNNLRKVLIKEITH
jgi:hypothetical protein